MRKIDLSRHAGNAKEKSYFIYDNKTKTEFSHVKFMENLTMCPLNCGSVRLSFEPQQQRFFDTVYYAVDCILYFINRTWHFADLAELRDFTRLIKNNGKNLYEI